MICKEWFGGGGITEYWGLTVEGGTIIPGGVSDWTKCLDVSGWVPGSGGERTGFVSLVE